MEKLKQMHRFLAGVALAVSLLWASSLAAQQNMRRPAAPGHRQTSAAPVPVKKAGGEVKYAYGVIGFDGTASNLLNALVNFPVVEGGQFSLVKYFGDENHDVTAGAYADGYYYFERTQTDLETQAMIPVDLQRYDIVNDKVTTVGQLSGYTSHINDMTYDYSTHTMYAISVRANAFSVLYTIDLQTAESHEVAVLDRRFFTLACTYAGQLYAISFEGDLCKVNKENGAVELVGATGWHPTYYQSMEFDHSDETLYWAANLIQGSGADDCIATVDTTTGAATKVAAVGDYPQIAGLYMPFSASAKGTPAAPADFGVEPDPDGANVATLGWTNPTRTFDGQPLASISEVKVFRNNTLVKTISGVKPGEEMEYVDNVGDGKGRFYHYTVLAANEVGDGAAVSDEVFVGHDVPSAVAGLKAVAEGYDKVRVSWSQPSYGPNGGYVDMQSVTYTVTRYPDGKVIAAGLKDTYVDDVLAKTQHYSYAVQAKNADGESNVLKTWAEVFGPAYGMPVTFDFTSDSADDSWTVIDGNADGYAWVWTETTTGRVMGHQPSNTAVSDDWLIGYYMPFEKDGIYRIDMSYHAYSHDKVELHLLDAMGTETPLQQIGTMETDGGAYGTLQHYNAIFKAPATGYYNIALHALSPMRADWLELYSLGVRKAENVNLAATAISGDAAPVQGQDGKYVVHVENQGVKTVYGFRVVLCDQDGNELTHKDDARTIKSGEGLDVELLWKPETTGVTAVCGKVTMPWAQGDNADANPDDDTTPMMTVKVREAFDGTVVSLGTETHTTASYGPFDFSKQYAAALNIYGADEIGTGNQNVVKVAWPYDAAWQYSDATDVPVRVYMGNTSLSDTKGGWIPESDLTLVYDGTVDIAKQSAGELTIVLDTPFAYEGGRNLAVLTAICSDQYFPYISFKQYTSPLDGNCAHEWGDYYTKQWFDFTQNGHQDYYGYTSSVLLYLTDRLADGIGSSVQNLAGVDYAVFDLGGRKVADGTFSADGTVDTKILGRGVYVVSYLFGGTQHSMKISVNK